MAPSHCIYCDMPLTGSGGEGDHVIPAIFGHFDGAFLFEQICKACNSRLGRCEEQLTRCAPEAYLRRVVMPPVARGKRGQSWVGAHGIAPPKFTIKQTGHHEQAELEPGPNHVLRPFDQLVVFDKDGQEHHIRLFPTMTAEHVRQKLEALGLPESGDCYLHNDAQHSSYYLSVLREIWPRASFESTGDTEAGPHTVHAVTTFTFHVDYFRALAKIGFHYYLLHSRRGLTGREPIFSALRSYLMEGGDHGLFFGRSNSGIRTGFGVVPGQGAVLPPQWMHIVGANEEGSSIIATVSLFMGPKHPARVHNILLGRASDNLVVPGACYAHEYVYSDEQGSAFAGQVHPLPLTRRR
ncbi:MAG: HNH endonuclease [Phycisphaerales bacterium]